MEADDSYTTELAAQLDALWEEGERRVIVCFDASSPVDAWMRWRHHHERQQQGYYQDGMLGSLERAIGRFEVVIFVWIHAHFGVTLNEWADAEAAAALGTPLVALQEGRRAHASVSFGHVRSAARQALQVQSAHVQTRLRLCTVETQWRAPGDIRLPRRRAADEDDLDAATALVGALSGEVVRHGQAVAVMDLCARACTAVSRRAALVRMPVGGGCG